MSDLNFDKLDALIALSVKDLVNREAEAFLQTEITVKPSEKVLQKIKRIILKRERSARHHMLLKTLKIAAIACLIALSILFTACVSIPTIREAIWKAVVEWYDDYVSVKYEPSEPPQVIPPSNDTPTPEPPPVVEKEPPKTIETINAPTEIPNGYMIMSYTGSLNFYQEYYDEEGNFAFVFSQGLKGRNHKIDYTAVTVSQIKINDIDCVLIIDDENMTSIVWEDAFYSYVLRGQFETQEEIIKIAKSVKPIE